MKIPPTPSDPMDLDVGQLMQFSESMQYIEERGFRWERFGDIFPFDPRIHSEGEWQRLVTAAVKSIESAVDRELLLDLIDAQLCVYGERCEAISTKFPEDEWGDKPLIGDREFTANMLQINSGIRVQMGHQPKDGRHAMMHLDTSIFDRICGEQLRIGIRE